VHGCEEWLEPARAKGVHELLVDLLGECTCEQPRATVADLYVVDQAREPEGQMTA
jgi:hypothetical protein